MANKTNNYKLPKPEADDFYDISEYNKTMDILDDSLTEMDEKKLDKNGDASEAITEFEQEILRENIESGETLSTTFGKVKKWFSEMKDVAFSGHAKDVATDAAHRFVSDAEKSSWNGKVGASGGDISETVIGTLESIDSKYPVPATGETAKVFMGKIKKYIQDMKPLDSDIMVYVAITGSDTTGDGTLTNPFSTINYALGKIPKNLCGYVASINVADGTYNESVHIKGFINGYLRLQRNGAFELNKLCNLKNIRVEHCDSIIISALNLTANNVDSIYANKCNFVAIQNCQSISTESEAHNSFDFQYISVGRISGCRSLNHNICLRSYSSNVYSENWSDDSIGISTGIYVDGGGIVTKGNVYQPKNKVPGGEFTTNGSVIVNKFGAKIGTLISDTTLYVSTIGSDSLGNGTITNPFATILHALSILPKDLGGHTASINVSPGIYIDDITFTGFHNGIFQLIPSGDITVGAITVISADVVCRGVDTAQQMITTRYISVLNGRLDCFSNINITTTGLLNDLGRKISILINRGDLYASGYITVTGNTDVAIHVTSISRVYIYAISGTGFSRGIVNTNNSIVCINNNNISATIPREYGGGAMFLNENGTQISSLITSGLSCTWGKLQGGYVRHGNLNGTAMVTIQALVIVTTNLSAGTIYVISGVPPAAFNGVPLAAHRNDAVSSCWIDPAGIKIMFKVNISSGDSFYISGTYLTFT